MALTRSLPRQTEAELLDELDFDPLAGEDEDWDAEDYLYPPAADRRRASFIQSVTLMLLVSALGWLALGAAMVSLLSLVVA